MGQSRQQLAGVRSRVLRRRMRAVLALRPATPAQLHRFVDVVLGLKVPRVAIDEGSTAPFD